MLQFIHVWIVALFVALTVQGAAIKVRINPSSIPIPYPEVDYSTWTISGGTSASTTISGVTFTLSVPSSTVLKGSSYKLIFTRMAAFLGERVIGEGMSTESTTGDAVTLTLKGLSAGTHTLLTFHNGWDNLSGGANIKITVDGTTAVSSQAQTIRKDNIWDSALSYISFSVSSTSQEVKIVYTPLTTSGITDLRAFLNGFEIDTPNIRGQTNFPIPSHTDEHFDGGSSGSVAASWGAPKSGAGSTYDVYFATNDATALSKVSSAQSGRTYTFSGLSTANIFYWRVDTRTSSGTVITGRVWTFRLRQLAFPGAEGWGRFARGGRGGKIVKVTSLADYSSSDTPVAGTLRYALTQVTGPRTVIFDIGGVITLTSRLTVNSNYVTIAGQTAPGKGIAIRGWPLGLSGASDVIVRHMRVRPGKVSGQTIDGMGMQGSNHCIFDRNSMGWAIDECFSSRSAYNITFQRNMISEPLNVAGHQNYPAGTAHGYAASIGGDKGSFHHNLIAHAEGRSWSMAGGVDAAGSFAGELDIRNNVVYNFGGRVTDGGAHKVNFVGNLYKRGPASTLTYDLQATYEDQLPGTQQYYCSGNSMPGYFSQTSTQVVSAGSSSNPVGACWAKVTIDPAPTYQEFFDTPFFEPYVETQTSTEAYKRVLSDSGAQFPVLDDHDTRIIKETVTGTTTYVGSVSGKKGIIDNEADVGGLESFPTTTRESWWDANNDGIADWWDGSNGGDAGWTALDGFLNFMADPHIFVTPGSTTSIDLTAYARGFVSPYTFTATVSKGTISVSGNTASYKAPSTDKTIDTIKLSIKDTEGSTWTRSIGVAIFTSGGSSTSTTATGGVSSTITSAPTATGAQTKYGQCGGSGWSGATACVAGSSCSSLNPYYYQCL